MGRAPNYSGLFVFPKLIGTKNESKQPRSFLLGRPVKVISTLPLGHIPTLTDAAHVRYRFNAKALNSNQFCY